METITYRGYKIHLKQVGGKFFCNVKADDESVLIKTGFQERPLINRCKDWIDDKIGDDDE